MRFSDAIASRLRKHGVAGRTVSIKVRFHDFRTITRSSTITEATDASLVIAREARALFDHIDPSTGVRLLGVSVSGLTEDAHRQLSFDAAGGPAWSEANKAIDEIRDRFGAGAIGPAVIAGEDRGSR